MPKDAYPAKGDVDAYLAGLPSVIVPAGYDATPNLLAAIAEWERATEYAPFLSTGAATVRRFDPPGPRTSRATRGGSRTLRLRAGLVSLTSLLVGADADSPGQALMPDVDLWLSPENAPDLGRPHTSIEFREVQWGEPRSIVVTGVWGFGTTIPDDAWLAVRDLAASDVLRTVREGLAGSNVEVKDDDVDVRKSIELIGQMGEGLATRASKVALAYRLLS